MSSWLLLAMVLGGYVLGSVPFGVVIARCLGTVDPRTAGSHNIGFTNVLRIAGKKAGLLTLAGDVGKGWVVAWAASQTIDREWWMLAVAASPIIGHVYPAFLHFRGGKGVATALGAIIGVAPWIGGTMFLIWIATAGIWRYSSAAAITAFIAFPVLAAGLRVGWEFQLFSLLVSGLILFKHKENAVRLWNGTEPRIGQQAIPT
ncbi:MAG: glycerol-3-phosphate 1-O-acyltransferase PlsY [Nitrospiraceae bacterium]